MAHVRRYLRIRPETDCPDLFTSGEGAALSYWCGRGIWRRMQKQSGVNCLGSHLIRHLLRIGMADQGAPVADIQDVLGHESDKMARHYAGEARKRQAAETMSKYSLAS
jgi:integrase